MSNENQHPARPILIVDDEDHSLNSFESVLESGKMTHFIRCQDSRNVLTILSENEVELMLLDLRMPHISGEELLPTIICEYPEVPVIVITGADDVETAVKCMKTGAFDYMVKPVEKSRLLLAVRRAIEIGSLQRENRQLKARVLSLELANPGAFSEIVSGSATMKSIFNYIEAVADSPQPVLITGETGTGKELIAKAIHTLRNPGGQFVAVNVAGLDDNVFVDTLFGHKKGAFTGADQPRSGLIETAAEGTLFLDEIGDLSVASQVKLLRLLQENEYFPLGADVAKRSSSRVVVATNVDLQERIANGSFRKDLYYRLSTHHIHIPPLRERREDIPLLLYHFLDECSKKMGRQQPTPPKELVTLLNGYSFPGNIRELQSMIFDAVGNHRLGVLSLKTFKAHISKEQTLMDPGTEEGISPVSSKVTFHEQLPTLKEIENLLVSEAMQRADDNQSIAALSLGISRQALNKRLSKMTR